MPIDGLSIGRLPIGLPIGAPLERDLDVTRAAQEAVVVEAALAAAVRDGDDVIGFPARARRPPGLAPDSVRGRRLRTRPFTVRLHHVEATQLAGPLVAFLDLLPYVPRTATDFPFVDARIAAERAARPGDGAPAPAADGLAGCIAFGDPPLIGGDRAGAPGAHGRIIGTVRTTP